MAARVFVTGGSGFVGTAVIEALLERGHAVTALVHRRGLRAHADRVHVVTHDLFDTAALVEAMRGCDAVIHLVGIIAEKPSQGVTFERIHFEAARSVIDAAQEAGARRFVLMSALGVRPDAVSAYHRTKFRAEEHLRRSNLAWTIIRPSVIHGPDGEFMQMAAGWARRRKPPFLFMPYFGAGLLGTRGAGRLQPVWVEDVARAFADALQSPQTVGEVYLLGGPDELTWPELHHTVSRAVVGKERAVVPIPAWYARLLTHVVPRPLLPFNREQVIMSQEDNTCDLTKFTADFGWTPQAFEPALRSYAARL